MTLRALTRSVRKAQGYPLHEPRPAMNTRGQVKGPALTRPLLEQRRRERALLANVLALRELQRRYNVWWRRAARFVARPWTALQRWRARRMAVQAKTIKPGSRP